MSSANRPTISVIIPARNEARCIDRCVESVWGGDTLEVIVVDGGSGDDTRKRASFAGANVIGAEPGRARQMNAGAKKALGDVFLFLHADCTLPKGAMGRLRAKLTGSDYQVGFFKQRIAGRHPMFRLIEIGSNLRAKWLDRPYGDQAMFFSKSAFEEIGCFPDVPIMEDLLIARAARRYKPFLVMADRVTSSARRWQEDGILQRTFRNWSVAWGERRGVSLEELRRQYYGDSNDCGGGSDKDISHYGDGGADDYSRSCDTLQPEHRRRVKRLSS